MKIDTQLNKVDATSKRAMKYVRYFQKTMMTDKLMMCLIVLIGVAVIALIVVAAVKKKEVVIVRE